MKEDKSNGTPVTQEVPPKKENPPKKLYILIAILSLMVVILLGIIFTPYIKAFGQEYFPSLPIWGEETEEETEESEDIEETEDTTEDTAVEEDTEETSTSVAITGDAVSAEVPEGWDIIEYFDGDGTDMVVADTTYTGLTGLEIVNVEDEVVFSMKAIDGIGFAGCGDYAIFADNSDSYYQEQVDMNNEIGETMTEHDYTNTEYSEFEWLGTTMRRIGDIYYYDTQEGNNYFEPPCVPSLITLEGLTFETDGYTGEAYDYGLEDIATDEERVIVDGILESMEVI